MSANKKSCPINFTIKRGTYTSDDNRFGIRRTGDRKGWFVVDLDTYNDATTKTLGAAKQWACDQAKKRR